MTHTSSFLHSAEPSFSPHPHRRRRRWQIFFSVLGAVVATWMLVLVFVTIQTVQAVSEVEGALRRAGDAAASMQFEEAHREVRRARAWVLRVERGVAVLNSARGLPWIGTQTQAAESMVQASSGILQAFDRLLTIGGDLLRLSGVSEEALRSMAAGLTPSLTFDDLPSETKRTLLQRLAASSDDFAATAADIRLAREELADIPRHSLFEPIRAVLQPIDDRLAISEKALGLAAVAAHLLPAFAGLDHERTTLLLFLNNDELRPGGGFIGTYGILRMKDGDIAALETQDVYRLDQAAAPSLRTTPPSALRTYGSIPTWFFRDSNWSPDFSVASRQGLELFEREARLVPDGARGEVPVSESVSGVIGFTPTFASALLAITGPVSVGGQTFTAENVADKLEYQVEIGYVGQGIPLAQRKEILADLVEEMKTRLYRLPVAEWPRLFAAVDAALLGKHLVFYSEDPASQAVIEQARWGGRILPEQGSDIQLVVDANLASLKSDPAVLKFGKTRMEPTSAGPRSATSTAARSTGGPRVIARMCASTCRAGQRWCARAGTSAATNFATPPSFRARWTSGRSLDLPRLAPSHPWNPGKRANSYLNISCRRK
jgi:hypothetical protein